ncbi:MAG TPA: RDD family protein, partial [Euzebyales bacterium]|nr:RDD family protein [Euzebyales bacterium]
MEHSNADMEHADTDALADARTTPPALRALSWLLDAVVVGVAMLVVPEPYPLIVPLGLAAAYLTLIVWWTSTTIGKAALGLRVVRTNGPVTLAWALGRSTLGLIVVDLLGAGLVPALSTERRALHDRAFHSLVVWTGEPATWRRVFERLVALADQREEEREEKRRRSRGLVLLTGLWAWMSDLARGIRAHVARWWRDAPPAGTSAGQALTAIVIGKVAV